jgi:hypothetical protein
MQIKSFTRWINYQLLQQSLHTEDNNTSNSDPSPSSSAIIVTNLASDLADGTILARVITQFTHKELAPLYPHYRPRATTNIHKIQNLNAILHFLRNDPSNGNESDREKIPIIPVESKSQIKSPSSLFGKWMTNSSSSSFSIQLSTALINGNLKNALDLVWSIIYLYEVKRVEYFGKAGSLLCLLHQLIY